MRTYFQEPRCSNYNHKRVSKITNFFIQRLIGCTATNPGTPLQRMRHQHTMVSQELAPLDDVVTASAQQRGTNNADYLG